MSWWVIGTGHLKQRVGSAVKKEPIYLGDGLYAEDQGYQIRLYASNGLETTNEVYLDREMLAKLNKWTARE